MVPIKIGKNRNLAIGLHRRRADPLDAGGGEGRMISVEIVGGEEQEHAACGLVADKRLLLRRGGAGEEDGGRVIGRARRADGHPAFVLLGLVAVLDQREAEFADVEGKRFVIVADEEGYVG